MTQPRSAARAEKATPRERALARGIAPMLPILGVALLVRLIDLGGRPMWYDEAMAVLQSEKGLASMLYGTLTVENGVAANVHPLLYHTLLWLWEQVVGTEAASVRLFSVLVGLGLVIVGYALARQLFADRVAVLTGWALALSPFQVHYAQEARMYALLALLLLGATLVYWRAFHRGRTVHWMIFGVLAAAAQYTHNLAAVYLIPLAATGLILRRRKQVLQTIGAGLLALLLYLPWLLHLPSQFARVEQSYWIGRPGLVELVRTLLVFVVGLPVPAWALSMAVFSAVFLVVLVVLSTVREWRVNPILTRRAIWVAYLSAGSVGLMFIVSWIQPVYLDRAMLAAGATFLIWIVWALDRKAVVPGLVYLGYAALALAFAVGLYGFFSYRGFPYAPYRALDAYLSAQIRPGEVIVHSNKISAIPAMYYDPGLSQTFLADPPQSGSNTLSRATQEMLGIESAENVESAVGDASGVWFIIFPGEIQDYLAAGSSQHPTLAWLESRYTLDRVEAFGELQAYHFLRARAGKRPSSIAMWTGAGA